MHKARVCLREASPRSDTVPLCIPTKHVLHKQDGPAYVHEHVMGFWNWDNKEILILNEIPQATFVHGKSAKLDVNDRDKKRTGGRLSHHPSREPEPKRGIQTVA